jgi:GNAT superfamily N-acetyltransferase
MSVVLETTRGPVVLCPEQAGDAAFLYGLFRSHMVPDLAGLGLDEAALERLVRMQFVAQTNGYRAQFPGARFDIVHFADVPVGRLIVDASTEAACVVDFALLPDRQGGGLGTAILARVLDGFTVVRCKVLWNNTVSLRMCQRLGFVQVGGELPFLQLEWRRVDPA